MNIQPESDSEAVAVKNELMLQPPAMHAPYPMNRPPIKVSIICFTDRIFLSLYLPLSKADKKAPINNPAFLRFGAIAFVNVSVWSVMTDGLFVK